MKTKIIILLSCFGLLFVACKKDSIVKGNETQTEYRNGHANGHGNPHNATTCEVPSGVHGHAANLCCGQYLCAVTWNYIDSVNVYRLTTIFPDGSEHHQTLTTGNYIGDINISYRPAPSYFEAPEGSTFRVQAFCMKTLNVNWYDYVNLISDTTLYSDYSNDITIHY